MKRLAALGFLFLVPDCANLPVETEPDQQRTAVAPRSVAQPTRAPARRLGPNCSKLEPQLDGEHKRVPRAYVMNCPLLPGQTREQLAPYTYSHAARLGVVNEVEEFAVLPVENQPAASLALLFYYPADKTELAQMKSGAMEGVQFVKAADVLTPDELASSRNRAALVREDRIYSQCNTLVMDVDRAAKDPARAQACSNTMAVIDRKRAARQQAKDHREQMAMAERQHAEQQAELEGIHDDTEASRRVQEKAYDWLRWREFNRAFFGPNSQAPLPPPR